MMYKVVGAVIYTIIDNYIFLNIWVCFRKSYPNTEISLKRPSPIGIPVMFINIISCHGFDKSSMSIVTLTWRSALVPYNPSKGSFIVEIEEGGVDNIPMSVKVQIYADNLHQ